MRGVTGPLIKLSIFLVVTIAATYVLAATITNSSYGKAVSYRADFTDVTGVVQGDDVRVAGVRVGTVKSIKVVKLGSRRVAQLKFSVQSSRKLPLLTHARIRYRNLVGQRYLEVAPPTPDEVSAAHVDPNAMLAKNAVIPLQRTENALDLTTLFAGFQPLFQGLNPSDINSLSQEIIQTLQGEGGSVDLLLQQTADLANSIADKDQVIGNLIDHLNSVLGAVADRDDQLSSLISTLQQFVSGYADDREAIGGAIDGVNQLATETTNLLVKVRPGVKKDVTELTGLAKNLNAAAPTIAGVLQRLPSKIGGLTRTASYGAWFNFYLCEMGGTITLPGNVTLNPGIRSPRPRCDS
ncbi:MAG TPA: MCE family protein [Jatrophihabitantaceae bacterium]|jgi:phospholipid/cholesterol/gamma-HCH transport system substrate-binding protein